MAFECIDIPEAKDLIENENAVVVDIRDAASFSAGAIEKVTLPSAEATQRLNLMFFISVGAFFYLFFLHFYALYYGMRYRIKALQRLYVFQVLVLTGIFAYLIISGIDLLLSFVTPATVSRSLRQRLSITIKLSLDPTLLFLSITIKLSLDPTLLTINHTNFEFCVRVYVWMDGWMFILRHT